jgi:hypothetical protein
VRIYKPKREELMDEWRKSHAEDLPNFSSQDFFLVMKSRKMRWAGHISCAGEKRNVKGGGRGSHDCACSHLNGRGLCIFPWKNIRIISRRIPEYLSPF